MLFLATHVFLLKHILSRLVMRNFIKRPPFPILLALTGTSSRRNPSPYKIGYDSPPPFQNPIRAAQSALPHYARPYRHSSPSEFSCRVSTDSGITSSTSPQFPTAFPIQPSQPRLQTTKSPNLVKRSNNTVPFPAFA